MRAIADTGFLVAFLAREDAYHDWALDLAAQVDEPLLSCEPVLAEAAFKVGGVSRVLGLIDKGLIKLSFDLAGNLPSIADLATRYANRRPDLADLCIVRMSELYPRHHVITVDRADFSVYRRNKREVIPIICPPEA